MSKESYCTVAELATIFKKDSSYFYRNKKNGIPIFDGLGRESEVREWQRERAAKKRLKNRRR